MLRAASPHAGYANNMQVTHSCGYVLGKLGHGFKQPTRRDPERSGNPSLPLIAMAAFAVRQFARSRLLHPFLGKL